MNKYDEIRGYEEGIKVLQAAIAKIRNEPKIVKRGDFIICTNSVDWSYSKGDRMWVDSVSNGHIHCRNAKPEYRDSGIYWVSNRDWVKE